jgi:hypothetical protein
LLEFGGHGNLLFFLLGSPRRFLPLFFALRLGFARFLLPSRLLRYSTFFLALPLLLTCKLCRRDPFAFRFFTSHPLLLGTSTFDVLFLSAFSRSDARLPLFLFPSGHFRLHLQHLLLESLLLRENAFHLCVG